MIKINCDLLPLYISLLKQKAYCNIDNIVYSKNDTKFSKINSNFDIIISETAATHPAASRRGIRGVAA